ncbi:hypothetical protein H5410_063955 [Solanum commersonii]|uniref:Uncharacterized protein n=1 Tax=Solanum commersonii TaxID=4109 RepID=A0A9J5W0L0_SOLCO|nr:hypothetical protein H5410_063955 [Solanum commersonii]
MFVEGNSLLRSLSSSSNSSGGRSFRTNYSPSNASGSGIIPRGRPFCDYRKRPGHFKDKCYRLHGYPPNPFPNNPNN